MTPKEQIEDLIKQLEGLYEIRSVTLRCEEYNKFHRELTDFVCNNKFENTTEWERIKSHLVYTPTQYMNTSEAKIIMTNLHELKIKLLAKKSSESWLRRLDKRWVIGTIISIIGFIISIIVDKNSSNNISQTFDGGSKIGTNIIGDNAIVNNNEQSVNTYYNQQVVSNDYGEKHRFKIANEITIETPISYVKQFLGNPHTLLSENSLQSYIYEFSEFHLKIQTLDNQKIKSLSFLLLDPKLKITLNKTHIILGMSTFEEVCKLTDNFEGYISSVRGEGMIECDSWIKTNYMDTWFIRCGIYYNSRINPEVEKLFHLKESGYDNITPYLNVSFNFITIARNKEDASVYIQ